MECENGVGVGKRASASNQTGVCIVHLTLTQFWCICLLAVYNYADLTNFFFSFSFLDTEIVKCSSFASERY